MVRLKVGQVYVLLCDKYEWFSTNSYSRVLTGPAIEVPRESLPPVNHSRRVTHTEAYNPVLTVWRDIIITVINVMNIDRPT